MQRSPYIVLIPVWCNWNKRNEKDNKQKTLVLIPVWCNWNRWRKRFKRNSTTVLIPVWCNWNGSSVTTTTVGEASFNSCMVQLKLICSPQAISLSACFNSCMVQLKCPQKFILISVQSRFNSCMVQLKSPLNQSIIEQAAVLIPVWCNWNGYGGKRSWYKTRSFNSCMVQLKLSNPITRLRRSFGF